MRALCKYILSLIAVLVCATTAQTYGQGRVVEAMFVPDSVLLGDHFDLIVEVDVEEGSRVAFPTIDADFAEGRIELIKEGKLDTLAVKNGRYHLRKSYRLTSFEPATYHLDTLALLCGSLRGLDTLRAPNALVLEVAMIPVDTAQKTIYDIKQPLPMPVKIAEFAGYTGLGLVIAAIVAGLALLIIGVLRKRKNPEGSKPKEPAHVVAIRSLEALSNQKLWQNGKIKEYYSRLTEILREYLEGRFGVSAMEMTSDEIVAAMKSLMLTKKQLTSLGELLMESDLVKFAKHTPAVEYHEEAYHTVYYFVEESKEVVEEVVNPEEQELVSVTVEEEKKDE